MYDTRPGIHVAEWKVHSRYGRNQCGDWRYAVRSARGQGACTNLLKHDYLKDERNNYMTPRELMVIVKTFELPQIPLWTRLPASYRPLFPKLSPHFQETVRTDGLLDPTSSRVQFYIQTSSGADTLHRRCCPLKILPGVMCSMI
jgi:hypothetical protein